MPNTPDAKATVAVVGENRVGPAFKAAIADANSTAKLIKSAFKGAFVGLSVAAVVTELREGVSTAIEFGDAIGKAAVKSGIGARELSELAYAAELSDINLDSLSTGIKKMQVTLSEAASGGKEANSTLKALGLTLDDLKDRAPDKQFEILADRIIRLKDPADRTRAAVALFGKAGADLLPMFEQGAEGIRTLRNEAVELGRSLDSEGVKRLQEADDAMKRLNASTQGLWQTLAIGLAPTIADVADNLRILSGGATELEKINRQIAFLEKAGAQTPDGKKIFVNLGTDDELPFLPSDKEYRARIDELKRQRRLLSAPVTHNRGLRLTDQSEDAPLPGFENEALKKSREEAEKLTQTSVEKELAIYADKEKAITLLRQNGAITQQQAEDRLLESANQRDKQRLDLAEDIDSYKIEMAEDLDSDVRKIIDDQFKDQNKELEESLKKRREDEENAAEYRDELARRNADNWKEFFTDAFQNMARSGEFSFKQLGRAILAELSNKKIKEAIDALFDAFSGRSGSSSGGLFGAIGSIFAGGLGGGASSGSGTIISGLPGATPPFSPFAKGTNYVPRDNFPALLHRGEAIVPAKYNPAAGGSMAPTININTHVDARGSTTDSLAALPEILRRRDENLKTDILEGIRRGRYALA